MASFELDARRLICPLPVIRTQKKVKTLQAGDCLSVICTDPGALHDIPAWCRIYGHTVVATEQDSELITITLQVAKRKEQ